MNDPLAWRRFKAPSLEEFEALATAAFRRLPERFRTLCEDVVIRVEDFPTDEVLDGMGLGATGRAVGECDGVGRR